MSETLPRLLDRKQIAAELNIILSSVALYLASH